MFHNRRNRWFWIGGLGLVAGTVLLLLWSLSHRQALEVTSILEASSQDGELSSRAVIEPVTAEPILATRTGAPLPPINFPQGSIQDACGLNEFPAWNDHFEAEDTVIASWANNPFNKEGNWIALESPTCTEALEAYISGVNPFLWGHAESIRNGAFAFIVLENPLTFGRVFADPGGDFKRVQDALSRPECLLQNTDSNWELKDSCHAEALMNYAILHRFCFDEGVHRRTQKTYWEEDDPTPAQDRFMWKEDLEDAWVRRKCEEIDPTLEFTSEMYPELHKFVKPLNQSTSGALVPILFANLKHSTSNARNTSEILIELAARLGEESAGLTKPFIKLYSHQYMEQGYQFGRFRGLLSSSPWRELQSKKEPSATRLLHTMYLLIGFERTQIEFDWEWLASHLCTPPYESLSPLGTETEEKRAEPKSCRVVVDELYARDDLPNFTLNLIDQFAQSATELGVYD